MGDKGRYIIYIFKFKGVKLELLTESIRSDKHNYHTFNCIANEGLNAKTTVKLKKELGLWSGVGFIVGKIIGAGIFVSPKGVLLESGSVGLSLCVWFASGLLVTIGALCYAELGTSVPKSGGEYAYIREGFGPFPAFLFLWVFIMVIMPAINAVTALTFANYILDPFFPICPAPDDAVRLIAAALIALLTIINCYNVKWVTKVQNGFTLAKIVSVLTIVVVGFIAFFKNESTKNFSEPFKGTSTSAGHIALAFYSGLFSFSGWNYLNFITEELKDPFKNLPRSIYISLPSVTIIFLFVNVAYFAVLTSEEVLDSNAVAVSFGEKTLGTMSWTMPFSVAISTIAAVNAGIFACSRLMFVGARVGHLPSMLAMVNVKYFTPITSIMFIGMVSMVYLSTTEIYDLINYSAFNEAFFAAISIASMIYLRWTQPSLPRPIKVNIILPFIFLLVCTFIVVLPFYTTPVESLIGLALTLSGVPVYFFTIYWKKKPKILNTIVDRFTYFVQKLLYCVESDEYKQ